MLEVELPLRHWLCGYDMSREMLLYCFCCPNFHYLDVIIKQIETFSYVQSLVCSRFIGSEAIVAALCYNALGVDDDAAAALQSSDLESEEEVDNNPTGEP